MKNALTKNLPQRCSYWALILCFIPLLLSGVAIGTATGANKPEELDIHLAGVRDQEAEVADQLLDLQQKFDLSPWIFTRQIRIKSGVIPHSHPVLTLNTRYLDNPEQLLAVFIHEQVHWFMEEPTNAVSIDAALSELRKIYSEVPNARNGGARNELSTYEHLIVNWLEFDALVALLGPDLARTVIENKDYYEWIYARVLEDTVELQSIIRQCGLRIQSDAP